MSHGRKSRVAVIMVSTAALLASAVITANASGDSSGTFLFGNGDDQTSGALFFDPFNLVVAAPVFGSAQPGEVTSVADYGDANLDGKVNDADYTIWADNFSSANPGWTKGDFNGDGRVDGYDYQIWAQNYGSAQEPIVVGGNPVTVKYIPPPRIPYRPPLRSPYYPH